MSWAEVTKLLVTGHWSAVWPLLLLPLAAAWISERAARTLPSTNADWRVAAALAGFPGVVMLILSLTAIGRGLFHMHGGDMGHAVQYQIVPLVALGILAYGLVRVRRRSADMAALMAQAVPPGPRLRAAAAALGTEAAELPIADCECFVAGFRTPRIYVSSGAVARLSDAELRAALCHERAHAAAFDPAFLGVLIFLGDIAPRSRRALDAYRQARERIADREAVRVVGPIPVASALLTLARQSKRPLHAVSMASSCASSWRLQAILGVEQPAAVVPSARLFVAGGLALDLGLAVWPVLQVYFAYILLCSCAAAGAA